MKKAFRFPQLNPRTNASGSALSLWYAVDGPKDFQNSISASWNPTCPLLAQDMPTKTS